MNRKRGFTLLELLIVVSMLAVIAVVIILLLNPAETFRKARDSQRLSDLASLESALQIAILDQTLAGTPDPDGPDYPADDTCVGEGDQRVFVSVPNTETGPTLPSGWNWAQVAPANIGLVNGSGWMPMDLTTVQGGSPLGNLPIDPTNTFSSGLYYTYICLRNPHYALTAKLEAAANQHDQAGSPMATDAGISYDLYEVGTNLSLTPDFVDRSLVGYWPLDGGTSGLISDGTTAGFEDASANGNNGTARNVGENNMAWTTGKSGGAVDFDGTDDSASLGAPASLDFDGTAQITIAAWAKLEDAIQNWPVIFAKQTLGASGGQYNLQFGEGTDRRPALFLHVGSWGSKVKVTSALSADAWYHIVATYDGSNATIYINGVLNNSAALTGNITDRTGHGGRIGMANNVFFDGTIDEVRIYNRALSAGEIQGYYDALN